MNEQRYEERPRGGPDARERQEQDDARRMSGPRPAIAEQTSSERTSAERTSGERTSGERTSSGEPGSIGEPGREAAETRAVRESAGPEPGERESQGRRRPRIDPDEAAGTGSTGTAGTAGSAPKKGRPILPGGSGDKLTIRLQHATGEFVDSPRDAVEEADAVLEEVTTLLTDGLAERRRTLRAGWQGESAKPDTETLRMELREYRELVERLIQV